jgi:hypothetical protein
MLINFLVARNPRRPRTVPSRAGVCMLEMEREREPEKYRWWLDEIEEGGREGGAVGQGCRQVLVLSWNPPVSASSHRPALPPCPARLRSPIRLAQAICPLPPSVRPSLTSARLPHQVAVASSIARTAAALPCPARRRHRHSPERARQRERDRASQVKGKSTAH